MNKNILGLNIFIGVSNIAFGLKVESRVNIVCGLMVLILTALVELIASSRK